MMRKLMKKKRKSWKKLLSQQGTWKKMNREQIPRIDHMNCPCPRLEPLTSQRSEIPLWQTIAEYKWQLVKCFDRCTMYNCLRRGLWCSLWLTIVYFVLFLGTLPLFLGSTTIPFHHYYQYHTYFPVLIIYFICFERYIIMLYGYAVIVLLLCKSMSLICVRTKKNPKVVQFHAVKYTNKTSAFTKYDW